MLFAGSSKLKLPTSLFISASGYLPSAGELFPIHQT